jgi:hypothetical protein
MWTYTLETLPLCQRISVTSRAGIATSRNTPREYLQQCLGCACFAKPDGIHGCTDQRVTIALRR